LSKILIYEIIDNPLIKSRPHMQQTLLEIVYITDLVSGRLALASYSTLYNRPYSNLDCSEAIMWEEWSLRCGRLCMRGFINSAVAQWCQRLRDCMQAKERHFKHAL